MWFPDGIVGDLGFGNGRSGALPGQEERVMQKREHKNQEETKMKVTDNREWIFLSKGEESIRFLDGSPNLEFDTAEKFAQSIHDTLVGKGLTYMHCFTILEIVRDTLRQERNISTL